jgi:DNA modification methylase
LDFNAEDTDGLTDPDEVPETPETPITVLGDVWILGKHRIVCGDSTDVASWDAMKTDPGTSFVFTSPPYGVGQNARIRDHYVPGADDRKSLYATHTDAPDEWPDLMNAWMGMAITHTCAVICNVQMLANNKKNLLLWMAEHADRFVDMAIWDKGHGAPQMQDNVLTNNHELLLIYSSNGNASRSIPFAEFHGTKGTTVSVAKEQNDFAGVHRAVMPVALAEWAIDLMCKANVVVDPFGGTGTTMMAAERKGKRSASVEMDPKYVDVAVKRWQDFTGKDAIHEATGKTFAQLTEAQQIKVE